MMYSTTYSAPTGTYTLVADDHGLVGVWLKGQKYYMYNLSGPIEERPDAPYLTAAVAWLDDYFDGKQPDISELSLVPRGTEFRRQVWNELKKMVMVKPRPTTILAKQLLTQTNSPLLMQLPAIRSPSLFPATE